MPTTTHPGGDAGRRLEARREEDRRCREQGRERVAGRLRRSGAAYAWWDRVFSRAGTGACALLVLGVLVTEIRRTFTGEAYFENPGSSLMIGLGIAGGAGCILGWLGVNAFYLSRDRALRWHARHHAVDVDDVETPFHP